MKKLGFTALFAALCLLAQPPAGRRGGPMMGFGPGPMGPGGMEMRSPVTGAPYSAVEVTTEQQTLAGGNAIQRQATRTVYRDGQGRVRVESQVTRPGADGQTATVTRITISDPVAGKIYDIDPQNKVVNARTVRPMGAQGAMSPRNPNSAEQVAGRGPGMRASRTPDPNVKAEDLGTQTVNSVIAKGSRTTHTIPAGTIGNSLPIQSVRETWMAADLKVPVMEKTTDPRFGTRTTQLTQINRGEPDASLFQIPADYTVHQGGPGGRGPRPGGARN
jgi:hypothetical protein